MLMFAAMAAAAIFLAGCETVPPPGVEAGPHGTIAYDVTIEASAPGAHILANGQDVGVTPLHLKIFGDKDGTFHDFGSSYYVIEATPVATNQFPQTRVFQTGHMMGPEDRIPQRIYFDMTQNQPAYAPGVPVVGYPYGPPAVYYGPPAYYYGPTFRFGFGGGYYHHPYYRHR
jgi:hypothetical protein